MIHIVSGLPRKGKTYWIVLLIIKLLLQGEKVFANFDVTYTKPLTIKEKIHNITSKDKIIPKTVSVLMWDRKYMTNHVGTDGKKYGGVRDAKLFLDEGHKDFPRGTMRLSPQEEDFFTEHGQNNLDIYLVSQRVGGINNVIREITNYFIRISSKTFFWVKKDIKGRRPFSSLTIEWFTSEKNMDRFDNNNYKKTKQFRHKKEKMGFRKDIAKSYETLWYRHVLPEEEYITWKQFVENIDIYVPSTEIITTDKQKPIDKIPDIVIKECISTLINQFKYKKDEATLFINTIILENELSTINTTEKLLRKAYHKRASVLVEDISNKVKDNGEKDKDEKVKVN
jgi:hypothetical protein